MIRIAAAALVIVVGCAPGGRECAERRAYLEKSSKVPRRYWQYSEHDVASDVELAMLVTSCKQGDREHDCAEVRKLLERPFATPPTGESGIWDPTPFEALKQLSYRDATVRDAVLAFVDEDGWKTYTPYSSEQQTSSRRDRLAELCHLPRVAVEVR